MNRYNNQGKEDAKGKPADYCGVQRYSGFQNAAKGFREVNGSVNTQYQGSQPGQLHNESLDKTTYHGQDQDSKENDVNAVHKKID